MEQRGRILLVEDDVEVAATLFELLTDRDYNVAVATSAEDALKTLSSDRPEVLLLDMSLPGRSGPELLTLFRRTRPGLPIIVVTAAVEPEILKRIAELDPFQLFSKPVDIGALDRAITSAITQSRRGRSGV